MVNAFMLLWSALSGLFRTRARLELEILVLRQQINVLRRKCPKRVAFGNFDRLMFVGLYRLVPSESNLTLGSQAVQANSLKRLVHRRIQLLDFHH
jgi:hypothetical protein